MTVSWNLSNEASADGESGAADGGVPSLGDGGHLTEQWSALARAAPARGAKVLLLRGGPGGSLDGARLDASDMKLDLQAPIDGLRAIKGDLELYYWERPGGTMHETERYQIRLWLRHITERTAALEGILMHMGGPVVVLAGLGCAEREALRSAASVLDRWIHEGESFQDVLRCVSAILHAADTICLSAAAGRPEHRARPPA